MLWGNCATAVRMRAVSSPAREQAQLCLAENSMTRLKVRKRGLQEEQDAGPWHRIQV